MLKKHQLYQQLKQDIQLLQWLPGTVLTQQQLAQHYGVSRIVVRDVQQSLLNEGWLLVHVCAYTHAGCLHIVSLCLFYAHVMYLVLCM